MSCHSIWIGLKEFYSNYFREYPWEQTVLTGNVSEFTFSSRPFTTFAVIQPVIKVKQSSKCWITWANVTPTTAKTTDKNQICFKIIILQNLDDACKFHFPLTWVINRISPCQMAKQYIPGSAIAGSNIWNGNSNTIPHNSWQGNTVVEFRGWVKAIG